MISTKRSSHSPLARKALIAVSACLLTASAWGAEIKFDQGDIVGTLSYDAATGVVTGTDIQYDLILGQGGTPLNNGFTRALLCDACRLNFKVSVAPDDGSGFMRLLQFGAENEIVLTGTILGNADGFPAATNPAFNGGVDYDGTDPDGTNAGGDAPILKGKFISTGSATDGLQVTNLGADGWQLDFKSAGLDTKADPLVEYFFGSSSINFRFFNTDFQLTGATVTLDGSGLVMTASGDNLSNADLNNIPTLLPEPGSTALVLLGLTGLAAFRRRKS